MERRLSSEKRKLLLEGAVIPAHPLALDSSRNFDEKHQRALTRYYVGAGAGGVAVGVHTTQFSIREKGLLEPVLRTAADAVADSHLHRPFIKVAGVCGPTKQAVREAELAADLGYDLALVSSVGVQNWTEGELLRRVEEIARVMPVFGFYLQPAVGGAVLSYDFWQRLADMGGVLAIKVAPFNRYQTLDVVRAVAASPRRKHVALYTGNDDSIVSDLLTEYRFHIDGQAVGVRMVGGLLGQFAVWTKFSVSILNRVQRLRKAKATPDNELLRLGAELTDANGAIFDSVHNFRASIIGIQEVLRRQGLTQSRLTLDPNEKMFPEHSDEIERVLKQHPALHHEDDSFVRIHLDEWLT